MKLSSLHALLFASLSAIGLAEISFDPLPLRLYTGDSCELHWSTDTDYVSTPHFCSYLLVLTFVLSDPRALARPTP
jgi:hypothetical protein